MPPFAEDGMSPEEMEQMYKEYVAQAEKEAPTTTESAEPAAETTAA
jgi:hypothetical protein